MDASDTPTHPAPHPADPAATPYGAPTTPPRPLRSRFTVRDVAAAKNRGEKWSMLTAYDATTAAVFDEAEIPVLLVGDSAANVVYGYDTTVPITVDELLPLVRAVVRGAPHAMVVADLPFGSYQGGPAEALASATRFLKEGGAHAVKLEGGSRVVRAVDALVGAGIPVIGHLGLTPQSIHTIGGYRVQGRDEAGEILLADALALEAAGAFAVVLEVVPADLATRVTKELRIATVGIGAGSGCDAQVLVWQDMAGLSGGRTPRFVKRYADLRTILADAARAYRADVRDGRYPTIEHSY
ncbi:ketopantoate hydroxymethyltransferase [Frankia casuarinae]|uniref:3-methyl-2-oxobutanoate hydroxymethyltransferase n=1 Tax=Frankia casuarinae (strain DSM 45818 / CECT 9043 / HFP020203 / CcI3) TaxID=106370 RepID=PANB_FRACC|nr:MULTISPECIES: 3-methyl-2-oxobutanoate hydroxymethyltransferase [Frankia]Q2J886.1 RecName: Full=3-methyl-2-oxobutanoate hydroxymethyltransferase; AltName: Full=Ketopantoate hydroxymethyltransferase; Short=KPHMT [Frankia casuarinae]ABD12506.1 ketopantoate hydroxymethyltransferase [Frankia casuarinae]ETA00443.1 ketopantoate hydroxymethyltransferase [Frankia sp. CcI6]EYT91186.1 ketopantoate hydroxymethyltransferase [Frankia casuarinae]KDA42311.1 ketopantoate hydroxymethyltransferase [Frankia sp